MRILNVVENYLSLENIIKILIDSILPRVYKMSLEHLVAPPKQEALQNYQPRVKRPRSKFDENHFKQR